jgi:hypothetical protein
MRIRNFLLVLGALTVSACFPYLATVKPGITGKVIDAKKGIPVIGADVQLSSWRGEMSTATLADGSFFIPGEQRWGLIIGAFDPVIYNCTVSVIAGGYSPASVKFKTSGIGPVVTQIGEIRIEPVGSD